MVEIVQIINFKNYDKFRDKNKTLSNGISIFR